MTAIYKKRPHKAQRRGDTELIPPLAVIVFSYEENTEYGNILHTVISNAEYIISDFILFVKK